MGTMKVITVILLLVVTMVTSIMPDHRNAAVKVTERDASFRLPKTVIPSSYIVTLKPLLSEPFTFEGNVKIKVKPLEDVNDIILHSNQLQIKTIKVLENLITKVDTTEANLDEVRHFLTIHDDTPFLKDVEYDIHIDFDGVLTDDMYGFYKSSYTTSNNEIRWLATTQFQPTHARRAFPCFDEPEFRATFKIYMNTPNGYESLSNMPMETVTDGEDGWRTFEFQETLSMSTYLVAFIVSDFQSVTVPNDKYLFSAWAHSEAIEHAKYSQDIGPSLVNFFEDFTDIEYKFPKIDQVALPDFAAGAMENWGLITYRETALLYYESISTESNKKGIALIVAHELAHMWFGNLVTLGWWGDTWLNEGFAQYLQYLSTAQVEKDWRLMEQLVVDHHQSVFATDSLLSAQALSSECNTPAEIMGKFTSISYSKGASVLRMLSHILTEDTFKKGLKNYLDTYQFGNTIPWQLLDALEKQRIADDSGTASVHQFFPLWTTQPGYPVITVTRNGTKISVTQERFLMKGTEEGSEKLRWWVPLTWTTESEAPAGFQSTQPKEWITPSTASKTFPVDINSDDWFILNNQETGYYRVNYDEDGWRLIVKGLEEDHEKIHILNRAQLVDDALNLARAGKLSYEIALQITHFLGKEEDYIPWVSAFNAFSFLDRRLISEDGHRHFKDYVLLLIGDTYQRLGFQEGTDDDQTTLLHRVNTLTWACRFSMPDCVEQTTKAFKEYQADETNNPIAANLRRTVFCTALEYGGADEWNFLWTRYQNSIIATEKVTILSALGCTKDEELLNQYLEKSIDSNSGIRKQDAASVFSAVISNPDGVGPAFEFLKNKYAQIAEQYGGMNAIANSIIGIAGRLTTQDQVNELDKFITDNAANLGSAAESGRNAIEAAKADFEWTNTHKDGIINWFRDQTEVTTESPDGVSSVHATSTIMIIFAFLAVLFMQRVQEY